MDGVGRVVEALGGSLTFSILNDLGLARLHDSDAGVCGSEINTNNATVVKTGKRLGRDEKISLLTRRNCLQSWKGVNVCRE